MENATPVELQTFPATRPFQRASCDHYLCDIHTVVISANETTYRARPWLSVLRDCATGVVLAFVLGFRAPSRIVLARLLRECVRIHGKLPEEIIVDNAPEFDSVYFAAFSAHYQMHKLFRPVGHPKYGSEAERFFNDCKNMCLDGLPGNTVNQGEIRSISGKHRPEFLAQLSLLDVWKEFRRFGRWQATTCSPTQRESPIAQFNCGTETYRVGGIPVEYDAEFLIASAVDTASVTPTSRGLHVGDGHYWRAELTSVTNGKRLPVRLDPEDPTVVYALINEHWLPCWSTKNSLAQRRESLFRLVNGVMDLDAKEARQQAKEDSEMALFANKVSEKTRQFHKRPAKLTESTNKMAVKGRHKKRPSRLAWN